jgi:large subunit ribosomal protein L18
LRVRGKIQGTAERPRLCVFRSLKHTYAQLIDDDQGKVLGSVSTVKLDGTKLPNGSNLAAAQEVGRSIAKTAKKLGVKQAVFDRNGYIYHGRVKMLAEAAREAGLKF